MEGYYHLLWIDTGPVAVFHNMSDLIKDVYRRGWTLSGVRIQLIHKNEGSFV